MSIVIYKAFHQINYMQHKLNPQVTASWHLQNLKNNNIEERQNNYILMFTIANLNFFNNSYYTINLCIPIFYFFYHNTRDIYYVLLFSSYYETIAIVALRVPGCA